MNKENILRNLYIEEKKPVSEIAQKLGVSVSAAYYAIRRYGMPKRPCQKDKKEAALY